jgi:hypothetical protein
LIGGGDGRQQNTSHSPISLDALRDLLWVIGASRPRRGG